MKGSRTFFSAEDNSEEPDYKEVEREQVVREKLVVWRRRGRIKLGHLAQSFTPI